MRLIGGIVDSGWLYIFGQFVDHDITLDTSSSLDCATDANAIHNMRTPALDLDSVYAMLREEQNAYLEGELKAARESVQKIGNKLNREAAVMEALDLLFLVN